MPDPPATRSSSPPARGLLAVLVLAPLIVTLALSAFAWPAARIAPRNLPIGVAGPPSAAAAVQQKLAHHEGAFEIHRYGDESAARAAIERRKIYGAVVVTAQGPHALTASAASPVVAQLIDRAVVRQPEAGKGRNRTDDVVATPKTDPRGAALSSSVLPLAIGGMAVGALVVMLGLRGGDAVAGLLGSAVLVGAAGAAVTDSWLGVLSGDWWAEAASIGLTVLAVSASVAGLAELAGPAGIGIGALLMVMLGNPFSGVTSAPEMLPEPVGALGQWLPPGAGGSLLRAVGFFAGRGADSPVLVLTSWALAGLTLVTLGGLRQGGSSRSAPGEARAPVPAT